VFERDGDAVVGPGVIAHPPPIAVPDRFVDGLGDEGTEPLPLTLNDHSIGQEPMKLHRPNRIRGRKPGA
jgi:hypothetical protein